MRRPILYIQNSSQLLGTCFWFHLAGIRPLWALDEPPCGPRYLFSSWAPAMAKNARGCVWYAPVVCMGTNFGRYYYILPRPSPPT
ncbi:hypothetical protein BJX66DRAFT_305062 [Aspergillus keveii]|uniref:Uncharacterized protein n=1 Tax=Aspergillus keveii TaxID=714993 RepID=A0ABR4G4F9_9EURO